MLSPPDVNVELERTYTLSPLAHATKTFPLGPVRTDDDVMLMVPDMVPHTITLRSAVDVTVEALTNIVAEVQSEL